MTLKLAVFLRRLIYYITHAEGNDAPTSYTTEFNQIRREILTPLINNLKAGLQSTDLGTSDIGFLVERLKLENKTLRWGLIIEFMFGFELGLSELCSIRINDISTQADEHSIEVRSSRRGPRYVKVTRTFLQEIGRCFEGKVYLFETKRSSSPAKPGNKQLDPKYLTKAIRRLSRRVIGREVTPMDILKTKKEKPRPGGQS